MRLSGVLVLSIVLALSLPTSVFADDGWSQNAPTVRVNEVLSYSSGAYCPTYRSTISVEGEGNFEACLFVGSRFTLAQYRSAGQPRAAIKYPYHSQFFRLHGACEEYWGCVYSAQADRLVAYEQVNGDVSVVAYDDASLRVSFELPLSFRFDRRDSRPLLPDGGELPRMGISANGRWLAAELKHRGIGLVDLEVGESVQVNVTGNLYGRGFDPVMELAVSDDGRSVAAAGLNMGLRLYDVKPECVRGIEEDHPTGGCPSTDAGVGSLISSFRSAHNPRFYGNDSLSLQLVSRNQPARMVTLQRSGTDTGKVEYLALGDSFTSGEGETDARFYDQRTNTSVNTCHTSRRAYPFLLGIESVRSVACAGATIGDIQSRAPYALANGTVPAEYFPGALPQSSYVAYAWPDVATIGIGGNDAGLMAKLAACAMPDTCFWAIEDGLRATAEEIRGLFGRLVGLYEQLSSLAPLTRFLAVGYPDIVGDGDRCDALTSILINAQERAYLRKAVAYLNEVIESAAKTAGIGFINIETSYDDHELCSGSPTPAMNGLRAGTDIAPLHFLPTLKIISSATFHPTPFGHELAAREIVAKYGDLRDLVWCQDGRRRCPQAFVAPEPPETWRAEVYAGERYHHIELVAKGPMEGQYTITIPPGWFRPGSAVSFELRSNQISLGEATLDTACSLTRIIRLPEGVSGGYHTLLVRGLAPDGTKIALYQAVGVEDGIESLFITTESGTVDRPSKHDRADAHVLTEVSRAAAASATLPKEGPPSVLGSMDLQSKPEPTWPLGLLGLLIIPFILIKLLRNAYNGTMANLRTIVKKLIPRDLFKKIEPYGHLGEAILMNIRYGFPARKLRIIGVTGTNGKTTTSFFIHRLLQESGIKTGLLTTVAYGLGDDILPQVQHMTTVQAGVLQRRLRNFARQGVEWVVVETSSHALAQNRVWGVPYEIAVMTNITHEHLDYHGTFNNYVEAKRRLFKIANRHGMRFGVVNSQDPSASKFVKSVANHTTYGIGEGELSADKVKLAADGSRYKATIDGDVYDIEVKIPGEFNVSNSLAAIAVGRKLGLSKAQIEKGIAALKSVEGRMSIVDEGQPFKVIIDFASTPDGFEKFFASVRPLVKGRLIAVFGSAGRRDEAKRPVQGEIAGRNADVVILTEEDDRDIDGNQILKEIAVGAKKAGKKEGADLHLILNREEAIGFAMAQATSKDDVVVLLGKGHEKTIERADGEYPWSEAEVARVALQELKKSNQSSK